LITLISDRASPVASDTVHCANIGSVEASLVGVEPLIGKLRNEVRRVDAEILAAIRQQVLIGLV
jgi:hypothetical protein